MYILNTKKLLVPRTEIIWMIATTAQPGYYSILLFENNVATSPPTGVNYYLIVIFTNH